MTQVENDQILEIVAETLNIEKEEVPVVINVIEIITDESFNKTIKKIWEESKQEIEDEIEDEQDVISEEKINERFKENLEAYLIDFEVDSNTVIYGRQEWGYADLNTAEEIAHQALDNLIDEAINNRRWVEEYLIPSWTRGESREEFIKRAVREDGVAHYLAAYDGNAEEFKHEGVFYVTWRHN